MDTDLFNVCFNDRLSLLTPGIAVVQRGTNQNFQGVFGLCEVLNLHSSFSCCNDTGNSEASAQLCLLETAINLKTVALASAQVRHTDRLKIKT